jgi:hypothetical protein
MAPANNHGVFDCVASLSVGPPLAVGAALLEHEALTELRLLLSSPKLIGVDPDFSRLSCLAND